jgi:uroporphyrinogen decarboxylase
MDMFRQIIRLKSTGGHQPNFESFKHTITHKEPGPVPFGELFADFEMVGNFLNQNVIDYTRILDSPSGKVAFKDILGGLRYIDQSVKFCLRNDWDYAYCFSSIPFPGFSYLLSENTSQEVGEDRRRFWVNDQSGPIQSWDDFERYPWPENIRGINILSRIMAKRVPEGMQVLVIPGGVFEWTTWLMGLTPFCFAVMDQPDLVDAIIEKAAQIIYQVVEDILAEPQVGGIFMGDDLGFNSGTLVSPQVLRKKFLPHTARIVDLTHQAEKLFLFHSCGDMYAVMDDLIEMGIDGKHSFEDKIQPVEEVYRQYSDRTAIIGGVDMDIMASGTEEDVRKRTREILEVCGHSGRYVLGTGNSAANYIPLRNYLAMIDEGRRWNKANFPKSR